MTTYDGVFMDGHGRLLNVPFWQHPDRKCTCECDGANPRCESAPRSRCFPCITECPEYKTYGPRLSEAANYRPASSNSVTANTTNLPE